MFHNKVLAMILAGGQGKRLLPLTRDRAKPAVPFGGRYRIIDFVIVDNKNLKDKKNPPAVTPTDFGLFSNQEMITLLLPRRDLLCCPCLH